MARFVLLVVYSIIVEVSSQAIASLYLTPLRDYARFDIWTKINNANERGVLDNSFIAFVKNFYDAAPRGRSNRFSSTPTESLELAMRFCCECEKYQLRCPICVSGGTYLCEMPFRRFSPSIQQWYRQFFKPHYDKEFALANYETVRVTNKLDSFFPISGNFHFSNLTAGQRCTPRLRHYSHLYGKVSELCVVILPKDETCVFSHESCDLSRVKQYNPSPSLKLCVAPYKKQFSVNFSGAKLCSPEGFSLDFIRMEQYLSLTSDPRSLPEFKDFTITGIRLKRRNVDDLEAILLDKRPFRTPNHYYGNILSRCNYIGTYGSTVDVSYLGNIALFPPNRGIKVYLNGYSSMYYSSLFDRTASCQSYQEEQSKAFPDLEFVIPFSNLTYTLFMNDLSGQKPLSETTKLARVLNETLHNFEKDRLISSVPLKQILNESFRFFESNSACNDLNRLGQCLYSSTFLSIVDRLSKNLNASIDEAVDKFIDSITRNTTCVGGVCQVGNWLTNIFSDVVKFFFEVFVDTILKTIFTLLLQILIDTLDEIIKLVEQLLLTLQPYLIKLVEIISGFLKFLSNLFIQILLFFETHFLLFEYTVVFLLVMWKWVNNPLFSIVIVVIAIIIFGFQRKHESLLLNLVNDEFNMSDN